MIGWAAEKLSEYFYNNRGSSVHSLCSGSSGEEVRTTKTEEAAATTATSSSGQLFVYCFSWLMVLNG